MATRLPSERYIHFQTPIQEVEGIGDAGIRKIGI